MSEIEVKYDNNGQDIKFSNEESKESIRQAYSDIQPEDDRKREKNKSPYKNRIITSSILLFIAGIVGLIVAISSNTNTKKTPNKSAEAQEAIESHISSVLSAGTVLLDQDDGYVGGDLTITHSSKEDESTLYIWDYAAEDGDYVQVLVDGVSLGDPFFIRNSPKKFKIPTVGKIEILGVKDGGGGITYAAYYEFNHTSYFNGTDVGSSNIYTLLRE